MVSVSKSGLALVTAVALGVGIGLTLNHVSPAQGSAEQGGAMANPHYTVVETEGHNLIVTDNQTNQLHFYTIDKGADIGSELKLRGSVDLTQVGKSGITPKKVNIQKWSRRLQPVSLKENAMRNFSCTAAFLILAAALAFGTAGDAQVAATAGAYNPYTGRSATASAAYNPYTGTSATSRTAYNPYTGTSAKTATVTNPYTGKSATGVAAYNPYTGRSAYAVGGRRWDAIHSVSLKENAMKTFICTAALLISVTGLAFGSTSDDQAAVGAAYYNPYTGRSETASAAYNPYTGTSATSRSASNSYTGTQVKTESAYNPYTGRSARGVEAYNPYTGRSAYAVAGRRR
jgi:hypothetical protein